MVQASQARKEPWLLTKTKLLVGEGLEEQVFFRELLRFMCLADIQVTQYEGKDKLREFLRALKNQEEFSGLQAVAITRDADSDAIAAFQSVSDALKNAGLPCPVRPGGFAAGPPRVGVLVIPPSQPQGMLEDLCLAAAQSDPAMVCVDEFMECVRVKANRQPGSLAKAKVHAWLASKETPDLCLGEAAKKGYWPLTDPVFDSLKQFLRDL